MIVPLCVQAVQQLVPRESDARPALDTGHISLTGAAKVPSPIAATEKMEAVPAAVIPSSLAQVSHSPSFWLSSNHHAKTVRQLSWLIQMAEINLIHAFFSNRAHPVPQTEPHNAA